MAELVIAAAINFATAYAINYAVGLLTPPIRSEGPRLGDLSAPKANYGAPIPLSFGNERLPGNPLWMPALREEKSIKSQGGKIGPKVETTIYRYYATWAVYFCRGPMDDVTRIWADGKLLYDKTDTNSLDIEDANLRFTFYSGDQSQRPDPEIQADKGVDDTPAFRGRCYMVIHDLPLKDFGNRRPAITAEVVQTRSVVKPTLAIDPYAEAEGGLTDNFQGNPVLIDPKRRRLFVHGLDSGIVAIKSVLIDSMTETAQNNILNNVVLSASQGTSDPVAVTCRLLGRTESGYIIWQNSGNTGTLYVMHPDTLQLTRYYGVDSNAVNFALTSGGFISVPLADGSMFAAGQSVNSDAVTDFFLIVNSIGAGDVGVFKADVDGTIEYVWDSNTFGLTITNAQCTCSHKEPRNSRAIFWVVDRASATDLVIRELHVGPGGVTSSFEQAASEGVEASVLVSLSPTDIADDESTITECSLILNDPVDDDLILQVEMGSGAVYLLKVERSTASVQWVTPWPLATRNTASGLQSTRLSGGVFADTVSGRLVAVRLSDGEITLDQTGWPAVVTSSDIVWDDKFKAMFTFTSGSGLTRMLPFRSSGQPTPLGDVVTAITGEVGLNPANIDVTELAGKTVAGYVVTRPMTARAAIEPLQAVYQFDGTESDYLLKFRLRDGKSPVFVISQDDLGVVDRASQDFLLSTRTQEVELPEKVTLTHQSLDRHYQPNTVRSKRVLSPDPTMRSQNELNQEVTMVVDDDSAKRLAEITLWSAWAQRDMKKALIGPRYLALDPTDVVTFSVPSGTYRTRITNQAIGADLSAELSAVVEDEQQFTSTAVADPGDAVLEDAIQASAFTNLLVLNVPLLRDTDDTGRTALAQYYFMGGYGGGGWRNAVLFRSTDGLEYEVEGSIIQEMTYGVVVSPPGGTDYPFMTDQTNTVTVRLITNIDEGLSSITQTQLLAGGNAFALISSSGNTEVLQFQNAAQNADGSWTLSNLLRGRRGTDWATEGHIVGETFLMLEAGPGSLLGVPLSDFGVTRYYKGVTSGQLEEDADVVTQIHAGYDLRPYPPVHLELTSGVVGTSDMTLGWVRRTRVGGDLLPLNGTVPLNEDSEEYKAEVLGGAGSDVVVRTFSGLASPTTTYTNAQHASDFAAGFFSAVDLLPNPSWDAHHGNWTLSDTTITVVDSEGSISAPDDGAGFGTFSQVSSASASISSDPVSLARILDSVGAGIAQVRATVAFNSNIEEDDTGRLDIVFVDADGNDISTESGAETNPTAGTWGDATTTATSVPANATHIRLEIHGTRNTGGNVNVAYDNLRLEFNYGGQPDRMTFRTRQVSAQVGDGFPSRDTTVGAV